MKNYIFALIALCSLLAFVSSASALTVNVATDVGGVDANIAQHTLLQGQAAELDWVQSKLGNNITFVIKHDDLTPGDWKQTNETGTWAFPLSGSPDYFLVKTGNTRINDFKDFLFSNNDAKSWAVLDLSDINFVTNIDKVSYINEYNGTSAPPVPLAPVPEPSTLLLLGVGMFGLAICGKRRMNKA